MPDRASSADPTDQGRRTPTDLILIGALLVALLVYLLADSLYATRGWDDADAGDVHVIGALLSGFVLLRLANWARGWLAAVILRRIGRLPSAALRGVAGIAWQSHTSASFPGSRSVNVLLVVAVVPLFRFAGPIDDRSVGAA